MTKNQLIDLDFLAINSEVSITLKLNYIIDMFAHQKVRKPHLTELVH